MARVFTIAVKDTDRTFPCAEDQAVLGAMIRERSGPVNHGCCGGGCGVCRMRVESGNWFAFKPMSAAHVSEADKKKGIVLLCCVQPRSDLVVAPVTS
ncbi:MAG: 2Fe-2S iron-sulfur cluster binding domain-containing protein [Spirochaetaceae bacterium]|jgi:ferredoxin|nr:2Fe-2S iron-sulfur cluster binding domain-containing protein [Spirochaetaceae bacterium]